MMERKEWKNLNGLWDYAIRPCGEAEPKTYDGEILVPFAVESSLSGVGVHLEDSQELWYTRQFEVPAGWKGKRVLLHFGAVDWRAHVWVNNTSVGKHEGGYTPFCFDTFGKQVSYPFGYGLSYTTFAYDKAAVKADNGVYTVSVEVKNTGKVAGKEVVQLYVSAPDVAANKPEKELKAFAKTKELKPGEAVVVTLKVNADDLASYDEAASAWVVTPGNYKFLVGASSRDIKATLEAEVAAATQKTNNILKLQEPMSLLKR